MLFPYLEASAVFIFAKMRFLVAFLSLFAIANAQFGGIFDQMFGGGGGGHDQQQRNNPSDAGNYRSRVDQCETSQPFFSCRNHLP